MQKENDRIKLSAVKTGIYNPYLASLRTMAMDDTLGKLSDEHIRTSLPADAELPEEVFYQYHSSSHYIPNYEAMPLYFMKWEDEKTAESLSFLNNPDLEERWKEFKKYLPMGMHRIEHIPQVKDFHFMNYHVRYMRPEARNPFQFHRKSPHRMRSHVKPVMGKAKELAKEKPVEAVKNNDGCGSARCSLLGK